MATDEDRKQEQVDSSPEELARAPLLMVLLLFVFPGIGAGLWLYCFPPPRSCLQVAISTRPSFAIGSAAFQAYRGAEEVCADFAVIDNVNDVSNGLMSGKFHIVWATTESLLRLYETNSKDPAQAILLVEESEADGFVEHTSAESLSLELAGGQVYVPEFSPAHWRLLDRIRGLNGGPNAAYKKNLAKNIHIADPQEIAQSGSPWKIAGLWPPYLEQVSGGNNAIRASKRPELAELHVEEYFVVRSSALGSDRDKDVVKFAKKWLEATKNPSSSEVRSQLPAVDVWRETQRNEIEQHILQTRWSSIERSINVLGAFGKEPEIVKFLRVGGRTGTTYGTLTQEYLPPAKSTANQPIQPFSPAIVEAIVGPLPQDPCENRGTHLHTVSFPDSGKSDIVPAEIQALNAVLNETAPGQFCVEGHADSSPGDNQAISEKRAAAVASHIQSRFDASSPLEIKARGLGISQPRTDNDTEIRRGLNRRAEIYYAR